MLERRTGTRSPSRLRGNLPPDDRTKFRSGTPDLDRAFPLGPSRPVPARQKFSRGPDANGFSSHIDFSAHCDHTEAVKEPLSPPEVRKLLLSILATGEVGSPVMPWPRWRRTA